MTRDERHRMLFSHMDGREMTFSMSGMPFRVMKPDAVVGGTMYIGDCRCCIRIVHRQENEKGRHYEVYFPHIELDEVVPQENTTLVGYMEIKGNWKKHEGKCIFHPIGGGERSH